jgi:hypothetical protein
MSAGRYEIRLKGRLGARWAVRFDGMTLTTRGRRHHRHRRPRRRSGGIARTAPHPPRPRPAAALGHPARPPVNPERRPRQRSRSNPANPQERKESRWARLGEPRSLPACCSSSPSSPRSRQRSCSMPRCWTTPTTSSVPAPTPAWPGRVPGGPAHHRQRRHRRRAVPHPQAAERRARARLCHRPAR